MSVGKSWKSQARQQSGKRIKHRHTHTHTHAASISWSWWCVHILSPVFSVCRGSTHYSVLSQGQTCVNAFSPLTFFFSPPPSAPSACFSADSGLWQSYLPFNPDQSPSYLQLLNHKHFIGSTLTLTDMGWWGFGVKCLWRLADAGLHSVRRKSWEHRPVELCPTLQTPILHSCRTVSARDTHSVTCVCVCVCVHVHSHI